MAAVEFRFWRKQRVDIPAKFEPPDVYYDDGGGGTWLLAAPWVPSGVLTVHATQVGIGTPGARRLRVAVYRESESYEIFPINAPPGSTLGGYFGGVITIDGATDIAPTFGPLTEAGKVLLGLRSFSASSGATAEWHRWTWRAYVDIPSWADTPVGVKQEWQSQPIGIAVDSLWGASGPWETGGGNTIAVDSAPFAAGDEIVIPLWATGEVTGVLTQPGATSQPTLLDSDGCVELTAAKILFPNVKTGADVRRLPRWKVHEAGSVRWTMEGTGPTSTRVASYAPFFVVPPAPSAPTISAVVPDEGTTLGGETVTVAGDGFTGATDITFDGTSGTTLAVVDDTEATIVTPAHAAGAVDVLVIGPAGTSNPRTFTYATPTPGVPTITSATPTEGPTTGGTSVLLVGTDLAAVTGVTFDGTTVAPSTVLDTAVIAASPAGTAGVTTLTVTDGTTVSNELAWEYTAAPEPPDGKMLQRVETVRRLLDLIRDSITDTSVTIGWVGPPRTDFTDDAILAGTVKTDKAKIPTIKAGAKVLDDHWTVDLVAIATAAGTSDPEEVDSCAQRAQDYASTITAILNTDPRLGDPGKQTVQAVASDIAGPEVAPMPNGSPGLMAWVLITVSVHQRLEVPQ